MSFNNVPHAPYAETRMWVRYDRKFAWLPIKTYTKEWVWLSVFYKKYLVFSYREINDISYYRCNLSKEDCIVDRLVNDTNTFDF